MVQLPVKGNTVLKPFGPIKKNVGTRIIALYT